MTSRQLIVEILDGDGLA